MCPSYEMRIGTLVGHDGLMSIDLPYGRYPLHPIKLLFVRDLNEALARLWSGDSMDFPPFNDPIYPIPDVSDVRGTSLPEMAAMRKDFNVGHHTKK